MSTYDYSSTYSGIDAGVGAAGAIVGGMLIFIVIIALIGITLAILNVVGQWKAFKKAGKAGWEAIIPIYNIYTLCTIVGVNTWWILIVFLGSIVLSVIPVIGQIAVPILSIYFGILLFVSTARSYGKNDGFAAGLYFLSPIFWMILGGKNTQYLGAKPMDDVVMNFINSKKGNNTTQNSTDNMNMNNGGFQQPMNNMSQQPMSNMNSEVVNEQPNVNFQNINQQPVNSQPVQKFCTNCGYKLSNGEKFCPGCGNSVQ